MNRLLLLFVLVGFVGCASSSSNNDMKKSEENWSLRMVKTVVEQNDSLTKYLGASESLRWQYDVAMLAQAIDKLGDVNPLYSKYMQSYMDIFIDDNGNISKYKMEDYNIDNINPGKNLITLYKRTGNEKYLTAIHTLVTQMESHPRTIEGGFWHKKRYPNQMWLDGIYMASPFLAQYAKEFNEPKWFDEVAFQIETIYKRTKDANTGLLYHAYDESRSEKWANKETGVSPHFWSRSMGWYVMAIVDVLDYLPENHPRRTALIEILQNTCDALLKVQDKESGMWYQVLDMGGKEGNYLEGSGSAMFTYAFTKGAKKGYLSAQYQDVALKAFDSMLKVFISKDANGYLVMKNICGGCGLGGNPYRDGSYDYYISEKIVTNDTKGVAPFIFAAIELNK